MPSRPARPAPSDRAERRDRCDHRPSYRGHTPRSGRAQRWLGWTAGLLAGTLLTACAATLRDPAPKVTQPPNLERPLVAPVHLYGGEPDADRIVLRPVPAPPAPPPPARWAIEPATPVLEDDFR